jgi:mevalonate kinase
MSNEEYHSNGKFLLSGEYLVLKGALSLAIPLKLGQTMNIRYPKISAGNLYWNTFVKDQLFVQTVYDWNNDQILFTNDKENAIYIRRILREAVRLNKEAEEKIQSAYVTNYLDFSPLLGLGSSSSLISNIAYWTKVDPFELLWRTSEGSGYDIACARAKGPIFYELNNGIPSYSPVNFNPDFIHHIYFVYLGQKVKSESSIQQYKVNLDENRERTSKISAITMDLINARSIDEFELSIVQHEKLISEVLNRPSVKRHLFSDYWGAVKSLGAWGGDFILATSTEDRYQVEKYFNEKGFSPVYSYKDLVL